jgi:hypothetical protein
MVMHMPRRRIRDPNETVIDFLARELPPARRDDAEHFATAIKEAGERYDRYDERRSEWEKYSRRRAGLLNLEKLAEDLVSALCSIDILTRDDLASRIGSEKIDYLVGLLCLLKPARRQTSARDAGAGQTYGSRQRKMDPHNGRHL